MIYFCVKFIYNEKTQYSGQEKLFSGLRQSGFETVRKST